MKYVSIDIETGGLNRKCSLLEIGAVIDDLKEQEALDKLPTFHAYILNDIIVGEPYALSMPGHATILKRIATEEKPWTYIRLEDLEISFFNFLCKNGYEGDAYPTVLPNGKMKKAGVEINVAGKNFAMFDKDWLQPAFSKGLVRFHRRLLDPAMLYADWLKDDQLPDSKKCMERAKLPGEVAHTAVEDAKMVCSLLRKHIFDMRS